MKDKFIIIDGTDSMCFGGFGNLLGNLSLLKYSEEEVRENLITYNNMEDNIRLVNSLLGSIRELNDRITKAIKYMESSQEFDYVIIEKTLEILRGEK